MSLRNRLARLEKDLPAPRAEHHAPESEREGPDLYWLLDQERKRAEDLEPSVLPYPPAARRRDQLRDLENTAWYREQWEKTGLDAVNEFALADQWERDALEEIERIDSGYYSADSTTADDYREDTDD